MSALIKNSFWGGLATALNMASGIVAVLIGIHLVGSEMFGYITLILSFFLLYVAVNNGIFTILVRQLHESFLQHDGQSGALIGAGLIYTLFAAGLLFTLVYLFGGSLISQVVYFGHDLQLEMEIVATLNLLVAAAVLDLFSMLAASALEGRGRFDLASKCMVTYSTILLAGMVVLLSTPLPVSLEQLAGVYLLASLLRFLVVHAVRFRTVGLMGYKPAHLIAGRQRMKRLLAEGSRIQGAGLLTFFIDPVNKILLNVYIGASGVTHYDLAMRAVTSVQNVFAQGFRSFMALPEDQGAHTVQVYLMLLGPSLRMAILMYMLTGAGLALLKGLGVIDIDYDVIYLFWIILPSGVAIVAVLPLYHVLIRRGDLNYIFRLKAFLALLNVGISLLMVPLIGLLGAGIGIAVATLINTVSVFRRFSTSVESIGGDAVLAQWKQLPLLVGFVLMLLLPVFILQLFEWSESNALLFALSAMMLAISLLLFEVGRVWKRRGEFV